MTEAQAKATEESVVEYTGGADVRRISADEWESAGVEGQSGTVWDSSNGYKVPVSELSDAAIKVLEANGGFTLPNA